MAPFRRWKAPAQRSRHQPGPVSDEPGAYQREDLTATVQAGVLRKQLNEEIRSTGLFFPVIRAPTPAWAAWPATRASGANAVRYGTMRENVMSLNREPMGASSARRARAQIVRGHDLTRIFVGSEARWASSPKSRSPVSAA